MEQTMTEEQLLEKLKELHEFLKDGTLFLSTEFDDSCTEDEGHISDHVGQATDAILQLIYDIEDGDNLKVYNFKGPKE